MNAKHLAAAAAVLALAVTGAACSSGSGSTTSSGAVAPAKWTAESKAGVRQLMAMAYQGSQLDCAVDIVTGIYGPEDWAWAAAHPTTGDSTETTLPARMKDLEDRSAAELERKCGIKDTRAEDKAKADAMDAYNAAVDEWNGLSQDQRDGFDGFSDWATKNGKPTSPPQ